MKFFFFMLLCTFFFSVAAQNKNDTLHYVKPLFDFNMEKSLFNLTPDEAANPNGFLRYYSLSGYREGVEPYIGQFNSAFGVQIDEKTNTRRIYMMNVSLVEMLTHFYDINQKIILEVKDPSTYRYLPQYGPKITWLRKNAKCFELMLPEGTLKGGILESILSQILNLHIGYEKRQLNTLVLSKKSDLENSGIGHKTTNQTPNHRYNTISIDSITKILNIPDEPFINESGYEGDIEIITNSHDIIDIFLLNEQLKKYNLILKKEIRENEVFVITEPNYIRNNEK